MAAVNALAERLRKVHKPYAGARFRAAFLKQGFSRFLTGSVIFCPEEVPSRPIADYGSLVLVEQWQPDQGEALTLLSKLLSGQAEIAGQKVEFSVSSSRTLNIDLTLSQIGCGPAGRCEAITTPPTLTAMSSCRSSKTRFSVSDSGPI